MPSPDLRHALAGTGLEIRPAGQADVPELARAYSETYPLDEKGADVFGKRWRATRPGWTADYHLLEMDGRPVGALYIEHAPWEVEPERHAYVMVLLAAPALTPERYRAAQTWLEGEAHAMGARRLIAAVLENQEAQAAILRSLGWVRDRLAKAWELDLVAHRVRLLEMAAATRAAMREQGIVLTTIAADAREDSGAMRKLHALDEAASQDVPHTEPIIPMDFEEWMKRCSHPDVFADRSWIAKDGDRTVALSSLRYPPTVGPVWTGFTACDAGYRGRGIARAVKIETLVQAIERGVAFVRTDNDESNGPMLHINETLGYHRIPGWLQFRKDL